METRMEFSKLNDLILQQVFKRISLNDRANLRLTNKRFKKIVDQFSIEDLVVFDRFPPIIDAYKFTNNERWTESDVAYVTNFDKFVKRFCNNLKNVKRLVIRSIGKFEYTFDINLNRLTHLELYNIKFRSAQILKSPKLMNLHMNETYFYETTKLNLKKLQNASISVENFDDKVPTSLKIWPQEFGYLKLEEHIRHANLFHIPPMRIRHLRIHSNISVAENFCLKFPTIRIMIITELDKSYFEIEKLLIFLMKKRDDPTFTMLIYGIKVEVSNVKLFLGLLIQILPTIEMTEAKIKLTVNDYLALHPNKFIRRMDDFRNQIESITFENNLDLFRKFDHMVNLRVIYLKLTNESAHHFDHILQYFPFLYRLTIEQKPMANLSNDLFDHTVCFQQLHYLNLQFFEHLNFSFLFKMTNLKYLIFTLYYPLRNSTFIEIIKTLKYLAYFQVQFQQPADNCSKEELSNFKHTFNSIVQNDLKMKDFKFSIVIQRKKLKSLNDTCVLKYTYERTNFLENLFQTPEKSNYQAVLDAIQYRGIAEPYQNVLNDDCLLKIIDYLDFIDRTRCRLVSHQFLRLIDGLKTRKLVIFDCRPALSNEKLIFSEEKYDQTDCISIVGISRFLNSQTVKHRLSSIEKLVIRGLSGQSEFHFYATFERLVHLELHYVYMLDSTLLKSPNIQNLVTNHSEFLGVDGSHFYLENLKSKIKQLSISPITEIGFYRQCSRNGKLSELETLNCHLNSFKTLVYISDNFKNLKTINIRLGESYKHLCDLLIDTELDELLIKLRPDLKVNLFGMPLTKSTSNMIKQLLLDLRGFEIDTINLVLFCDFPNIKNIFCNNEYGSLLDNFCKQINFLYFTNELENFRFHKKFPNVNVVRIEFSFNHISFDKMIKLYPNITGLYLASPSEGHRWNAILNRLPVYCRNLIDLCMENFYHAISYDFLLEFKNLKTIKLWMREPFKDRLFIEMIRNLKHLSFVEIFFEKSDKIDKEQLSSFKKLVEKCLFEELRSTDSVFKIEIHSRRDSAINENYKIVRYVFKRFKKDVVFNSLIGHEDDLFKMQCRIQTARFLKFLE